MLCRILMGGVLGCYLSLMGCKRYVSEDQLAQVHQTYAKSQQELQQNIALLERVVANQECTANLQDIINQIHSTCKDPRGIHQSGHCDPEQLRSRISKFQRRVGTQFIRELSILRHVVFYLGTGQTSVPKERLEQLDALISLPRLRTTWYVILTSPKLGEAEANRRVQWAEDLLIKQSQNKPTKLSKKHFLRPWILDVFSEVKPEVKLEDVMFVDKPIKNSAEPQNLQRAVWVIRLSCLPYSPEDGGE